MSNFEGQIVFSQSHHHETISSLKHLYNCRQIWNSREARFEDCFLPIISLLPGLITCLVLLSRALQYLPSKRPQWLRNFIVEYDADQSYEAPKKPRLTPWSGILVALSFVGLVFELVNAAWPRWTFTAVVPVISWATIVLLILIDRARTAPFSPLIILLTLASTQITLLLNDTDGLQTSDLPNFFSILASIGAIATILCMPIRDPELSNDNISAPYDPPSKKDRSPEDRLSPWLFMTVSWMNPLINAGSKRQLEDDDVWALGHEFQHKGLHDKFRELKGSVVRRLLAANGVDLIILTCLALLEAACDMAMPILLQQLLRSMEDLSTPQRAAIVYAIIRLVVRLIDYQADVFSLWYGRRCYERSRGEMVTMLHEKVLSRKIIGASAQGEDKNPKIDQKAPKDEAKQPASMGKILNLMRNDVYEVSQRFWEFERLILVPLRLILSVVLVWTLIGWPCLFGVLTVVIAQAVNALITRVLLKWERIRRAATDAKLQKTSQFVEAIRHLRWYGWQEFWLGQILDARQKELNLRVRTSFWTIVITTTNTFASGMFPVASFYAYTVWAGKPLRVDVAFPALQLFSMMESGLRNIPQLITTLLNAKIAVDRIENFMSEPEKESDRAQLSLGDETAQLAVEDASFAWPGTETSILTNITLRFPVGMTVVFGEVAAGKSALLQSLLGEMDVKQGKVSGPSGIYGYCAQSPWLQSMSIRDNILFASPFDETRYRNVIDACALTPDMASFKDGDQSLIGENGIGLSGGQRARVALARAVYSRSRILLLDDPLSALDHQTADSIVRNCFQGQLVNGRILVLVTHRIDLCRRVAQQLVEIDSGKARVLDEAAELPSLSTIQSRESVDKDKERKGSQGDDTAMPEKFMEEEKRAQGGVKLRVYWEYIKAGRILFWILLIGSIAIYRFVDIGEDWFLKEWGEAYDEPSTAASSGLLHRLPSPEMNIRPWLVGFFILAVLKSLLLLVSRIITLCIVYTAGKNMFKDIMHSVAHATFRFYDVTPVGQIMNRMTSDIGTIDGNISYEFQNFAYQMITWIGAVVVVASVTPVFLLFSITLTVMYVYIFLKFLPTSQSLRRLEMVSLTPLLSNFGALLHGLTTVRAFCAQSRFQGRVIEVTDAFQKMDHFYWSLQAWLEYRFDLLAVMSTFILTLLALYTGVSAGLTAFVLIASSKFVHATHSLCRQYGQLQMDFVSVERIVELLHLDQEPKGTVDPPASWPSYGGDISFENVTIRYAPHFEPSLSNISFRIPAGSTTALLGRTGSGKSTLALSLLATILPSHGTITIDGIDIMKVNTQTLRHRITFLAQDPVLFPGTMHENLDPLGEHTKEDCEAVLQRVCAKHNWKLETEIDTGGGNLSQGQRQLVGLTRAVLRRSPIIILDEATASIDTETAMEIQQILREEMRESTVITIAHRLEAVKNADFFIRLDKGKLIAAGPVDEGTMQVGGTDGTATSNE